MCGFVNVPLMQYSSQVRHRSTSMYPTRLRVAVTKSNELFFTWWLLKYQHRCFHFCLIRPRLLRLSESNCDRHVREISNTFCRHLCIVKDPKFTILLEVMTSVARYYWSERTNRQNTSVKFNIFFITWNIGILFIRIFLEMQLIAEIHRNYC